MRFCRICLVFIKAEVSAALMSKAQACGAACDCNLSISSGPRGAETHSHRPLIVLPRLMLVVCSSLH